MKHMIAALLAVSLILAGCSITPNDTLLTPPTPISSDIVVSYAGQKVIDYEWFNKLNTSKLGGYQPMTKIYFDDGWYIVWPNQLHLIIGATYDFHSDGTFTLVNDGE